MKKLSKNTFSFGYMKIVTSALAAILMSFSGMTAMAATRPIPMHRLYNTTSGQHLFTTDLNEVNVLLGNSIWKEETVTFRVYDNCTDGQPNATSSIQRYVASNGLHLLTADSNEIAILSTNKSASRYIAEGNPNGFGCVSMTQIAGTIPVYRLYNHVNGEHLLTADGNESNSLNGKNNWSLEGVAFYAYL